MTAKVILYGGPILTVLGWILYMTGAMTFLIGAGMALAFCLLLVGANEIDRNQVYLDKRWQAEQTAERAGIIGTQQQIADAIYNLHDREQAEALLRNPAILAYLNQPIPRHTRRPRNYKPADGLSRRQFDKLMGLLAEQPRPEPEAEPSKQQSAIPAAVIIAIVVIIVALLNR